MRLLTLTYWIARRWYLYRVLCGIPAIAIEKVMVEQEIAECERRIRKAHYTLDQ